MLDTKECRYNTCPEGQICGRMPQKRVCDEKSIMELLHDFESVIVGEARKQFPPEISEHATMIDLLQLLYHGGKRVSKEDLCQDLRRLSKKISPFCEAKAKEICVPSSLCHPCLPTSEANLYKMYGTTFRRLKSVQALWQLTLRKLEMDPHIQMPPNIYEILANKNAPPCSTLAALQRYGLMSDQEKLASTPIFTLQWVQNSCYCDAVLTALLTNRRSWIVREILKTSKRIDDWKGHLCQGKDSKTEKAILRQIYNETKKVYNAMHDKKPKVGQINSITTNVREWVDRCPSCVTEKYSGRMADASEFLQRLLDLLLIPPEPIETKVQTVVGIRGDPSNEIVYDVAQSHIPLIITTFVSTEDGTNLANLLPYPEIKELRGPQPGTFKEIRTFITRAPYAILKYPRRQISPEGKTYFNDTAIRLNPSLVLGESKMQLEAVICFTSAHFVTFFRDRNGIWFYYDDREKSPILDQMDFNLMSQLVMRIGLLFFYSNPTWVD